MPNSLHQRPTTHTSLTNFYQFSPSLTPHRPTKINLIFLLLLLLLFMGFLFPYLGITNSLLISPQKLQFQQKWRNYSLKEAVNYVGQNGTVLICIVSQPYLLFLNNWLISVKRFNRHHNVLVIAEDYYSLFTINERWPGHAVLIPPVLESNNAHKFGSQGFFNFTARRPRHLLSILELGYNVMYNDVDMVWLKDLFPYLEGNHDIYFMDDMATVKPLNHSHGLPPPGKKGRPYICSCLIYSRPTYGGKLVMRKWIQELEEQPWTRTQKSNDQPAFNWALMKIANEVDMYLLPQSAFPTGGLYFKNKTWVRQTKGAHAIIHNNYIVGFEKKIKRFRDYGLWLVDDHASESPLGIL